MKALREFFVVILSSILVVVITSLGLLLSFKGVLYTTVISEGVKSIVKSEEFTPEQQKEINDAVDKITSNKEVSELIDSALEDVAKSENGKLNVSDETIDKFINIIENNKEELIKFGVTEQEINQFINDAKDPKNRQEIKESMDKGYEQLNINMGDNQSVNVVQTFGKMVSKDTIIKLGILIAIIVVLIMLLKWSLYEWIRPCAISSIIASINILVIYYGIDFITKSLLTDTDIPISLNADMLNKVGYTILAGGVTSLVIYILIKVLININKKNKEVSTEIKEEKKPIFTEEIPVGEKDVPIEKDPINPEKFCPGCGAPISEEDEICGSCGAPLETKKEG